MNRPSTSVLIALLCVGCFDSPSAADAQSASPTSAQVPTAPVAAATPGVTPIYVTVGAHLENKLPLPCEQEGCSGHCQEAYLRFRANIVDYAELMQRYGASYNVQTNFHLPLLEEACVDDATRAATTNGKHLLVYLMEDLGAMIDTHAHESQIERHKAIYNYADVSQLLVDAGVPRDTLTVVGGCLAGSSEQFARFQGGFEGSHFPDLRWTPELFTFPAVHDHDPSGEDFTSGLWRPGDFDWEPAAGRMGEKYYSHDPAGEHIMVGSGYLHSCAGRYPKGSFWLASDYVVTLARYLEQGKAPAGRMYTATVAMNQKHFKDPDTYMGFIEQELKDLQPLVDSGQVIYKHYQELPAIWARDYDSQPNLYRFEDIDPADYTCDGQGQAIGTAAGRQLVLPPGQGKGSKQRPQGQRPEAGGRGGGGGGKKAGGGKR